MKIKFMGAARTVTGSCYIIETQGRRFAIDCGMHQGNTEMEKRNLDVDIYEPDKIEFFLITHAHIDHSGLLPRMVQKGFHGRIYTTAPTKDLIEIMLLDSAHIQEMEAEWKNKKLLRWGRKQVWPLYMVKDALATYPLLEARSYDEPFSPFPGMQINFKDAGHILGSALVELWVEENGSPSKLVFSGDIGRPAQLLVKDASIVRNADFLFLESTYGDRDHKNEEDSLNELAGAIAYSHGHGEKVIIPAFALERTQEIIYSLHLLSKDGRLPRDMPVYLDSPLAIQAMGIFRQHPEYFDQSTRDLLTKGEDPLSLPHLHFTVTVQESMAINNFKGPAVIISASGMADAGRIKHHLKHTIWRRGTSIVFVGFQAQGTIGRKIVDGAEKIRLFHEEVAVQAKVYTINGFSAHAGQSQILEWLSHFEKGNMQVFLVHGEYSAQQTLADLIRKRFGFKVLIPEYLEEEILKPGEKLQRIKSPERLPPGMDWGVLLQDMETQLAQLRSQKAQLELKAWAEQAELQERLQGVKRNLAEILSKI
jgi:metallo-beta-lactamase family protein